MNRTYLIIIALVLIAVALFFGFKGQRTEAPTVLNPDQVTGVDTNPTGVTPVENTSSEIPEGVACTMDAKLCPDGSYVGRTGPKCEFKACPGETSSAVKEFTVSGSNFAFAPSTMSVNKGDKVRITFKNIEGNHDLKIDELGVNTGIIKAGEQKVVEFVATKSGSFEYYCSVGSHRAMGMKGTLTVK